MTKLRGEYPTKLSPRLVQIVSLAVEGRATEEIAKELGITVGTVGVQLNRACQILKVRRQSELVQAWKARAS